MKTFKIVNKLTTYKFITRAGKNLLFVSLTGSCVLVNLKNFNNIYISNKILPYIRLYRIIFKIKGFGFKWKHFFNLRKYKPIILKLGLTHRILMIMNNNALIILRKKAFTIKHRDYFDFTLLKTIFYFYLNFLYYKKGIYLKGALFQQKVSKRKSKF